MGEIFFLDIVWFVTIIIAAPNEAIKAKIIPWIFKSSVDGLKARNNPEIKLEGPVPPDTCWISAAHAWENGQNSQCPDGILALYHDQGLIPVKTLDFNHSINVTGGLPFLRVSPDHGPAFDIAKKMLQILRV